MIGEYGQHISDSPYLLENLIEEYLELEPEVRSELLTSAVKLFFRRPGEMQRVLGDLFHRCLSGEAEQAIDPADAGAANANFQVDIRDKALMYYRLLSVAGIDEAKRVINGLKEKVLQFEEDPWGVRNKLDKEFGSLAVM